MKDLGKQIQDLIMSEVNKIVEEVENTEMYIIEKDDLNEGYIILDANEFGIDLEENQLLVSNKELKF